MMHQKDLSVLQQENQQLQETVMNLKHQLKSAHRKEMERAKGLKTAFESYFTSCSENGHQNND